MPSQLRNNIIKKAGEQTALLTSVHSLLKPPVIFQLPGGLVHLALMWPQSKKFCLTGCSINMLYFLCYIKVVLIFLSKLGTKKQLPRAKFVNREMFIEYSYQCAAVSIPL